MLGDFGEVYVLDWGVARVLEDAWVQRPKVEGMDVPVGRTQAGAFVGTPGYAAPEQVQGDRQVGEPSDVYALGAILFELLALAPLHQGASVEALVASTLAAGAAKPGAQVSAPRGPAGARRHLRAGDGSRARRTSFPSAPRDAGGFLRALPRRRARRGAPPQASRAPRGARRRRPSKAAAARRARPVRPERARGNARARERRWPSSPRTRTLSAPSCAFCSISRCHAASEAEAEFKAARGDDQRTRAARDSMLAYSFLALSACPCC